jgi:hypothetical protein
MDTYQQEVERSYRRAFVAIIFEHDSNITGDRKVALVDDLIGMFRDGDFAVGHGSPQGIFDRLMSRVRPATLGRYVDTLVAGRASHVGR